MQCTRSRTSPHRWLILIASSAVLSGQPTSKSSLVVPYEPSTAPAWLKADPQAIILPEHQLHSITTMGPDHERIMDAGLRRTWTWWSSSCRDSRTSPIFKIRLVIVYGKMDRGLPWIHEPPGGAIWNNSHWHCPEIDGTDGRGVAPDGRRWRYVTLSSGVAEYDGIPPDAADYFDKILDTACRGNCASRRGVVLLRANPFDSQ